MTDQPTTIAVTFARGLRRALRPSTVVPLYLASLVLGIIQSWPLLALLGSIGSRNPFLDELNQGGIRTYIDLFLGVPNSGTVIGVWTLGLLPSSAVFGLVYNFFSGGIIGTWHTTERGFWRSSWRFFLTFVALQLFLVLVATLVIVVGGATIATAPVVVAIVGGVVLQLLNSVGEIGRAYAVVANRRNPFSVLGAGFTFAARQLPGFLLLTIGGVLLHALLIGCAWLLAMVVPASPFSFVWQQLVLLAAIAVKVIRLSWATALAEATPVDYSSRNASAGDVRAMR